MRGNLARDASQRQAPILLARPQRSLGPAHEHGQRLREPGREPFAGLEADPDELGPLVRREEVVVARDEIVAEAEIPRTAPEPVLAGGDLLDVEPRALLGDEALEDAVDLLDVLR